MLLVIKFPKSYCILLCLVSDCFGHCVDSSNDSVNALRLCEVPKKMSGSEGFFFGILQNRELYEGATEGRTFMKSGSCSALYRRRAQRAFCTTRKYAYLSRPHHKDKLEHSTSKYP